MSEQEIKDMGGRFTALLLQNQKRIYGLILSLVPNGPDADDIMQEACSIMWKKFESFEEGTNFSAWALRIARYQVMTYYNKTKRSRARLSDESLDLIADKMAEVDIDKAARSENLKACLQKLSEGNREMIQLRFQKNLSVEEVSSTMDRSIHAVYKALNRSYSQLQRCMRLGGAS